MIHGADCPTISRQLLTVNPDNHTYHTGLREVLGLLPSSSGDWSDRQQAELEALYEGLVQDFPKNLTPPRMQLDFLVRSRACRFNKESMNLQQENLPG